MSQQLLGPEGTLTAGDEVLYHRPDGRWSPALVTGISPTGLLHLRLDTEPACEVRSVGVGRAPGQWIPYPEVRAPLLDARP